MMGGLPVEMITMLGSSLLGGFMSIWGQSILGLVITPLDTHLMSAIVGLYFGGSLVKK